MDGGGDSTCVDWYDVGHYLYVSGYVFRCSWTPGQFNMWGNQVNWVHA